jgi:hypothetical protein
MALYRCLFFIGADNKMTNLEEADHTDDSMANDWGVALLRRHPHYKACEVWLRQRLICRHDQA